MQSLIGLPTLKLEVMINVYAPVRHCDPCQPSKQSQILGAIQFPCTHVLGGQTAMNYNLKKNTKINFIIILQYDLMK